MERQNHTALPFFSSCAVPHRFWGVILLGEAQRRCWEARKLENLQSRQSAQICVSSVPTGFHGTRLPYIPMEKATHWEGIELFAKGPCDSCKSLFYQAFWDLFTRSLHTSGMALSLKTLAVWRGLLTPPELLFSLGVSSLHSRKSVQQHRTSADLCAQAGCWSQTRKTSAEHTWVLALYQKLIPPLKCTMTKCIAFQKGRLHSVVPGHMEIIKPAWKAVRVPKTVYLL